MGPEELLMDESNNVWGWMETVARDEFLIATISVGLLAMS